MSWGRFNNFNPYQGPARAGMRRCPAPKPGPSTVVVIEEDDEGGDASDSEVFIIDPAVAPGCHARKGNGSSGNVINIDDDEDLEEGTGWDKAGPSTSRASGSPASMTPGRGSPGSRYGLDSASDSSESDLSEGWDSDTDDSGSSDCEILDDTAGTAREMWETAASRKKMPHGVHEREDARATAFTSCARSEAQPDKNSEGLFGAGCNLDANFSAAECHPNENIFQGSSDSCKGGEQNNTGGLKDDHGSSSPPNAKQCSNGEEGVVPEKTSEVFQSPLPDQTSVHNFASANRVFPGSSADRKDGSPPMSVSTPEKIDEKIPEGVYSQKDQSPPEAFINTDMYSAQDDGSVRGQQKQFALVQDASVIGDREKHKESIEYKRAAEEEWASRQRQLQIQAEEAKKLRKRKKAEAQRLLDMEKRQKQRLQEVRESQRKNEEAIQLKEQYRGVVRKELEDMERRYLDMTSILHVLGIPVEGGEVKAYKQALLKFHPDRVSRNDIYQQVKAEETFKFISRLKEKLPRFS